MSYLPKKLRTGVQLSLSWFQSFLLVLFFFLLLFLFSFSSLLLFRYPLSGRRDAFDDSASFVYIDICQPSHVHSLYRVLLGPLCDVAMPVSLGLSPFFDPSTLHMSILCTVFFLVHSVMLLCQFPRACLPSLTPPRYTCPFSVPCSSWSTLWCCYASFPGHPSLLWPLHVTHVHSLYRVLPGPLCDVAMSVSLGHDPFFDPSTLHISMPCRPLFAQCSCLSVDTSTSLELSAFYDLQ